MTSEWEHFIAGLTPALLERELARVHGDLEQERVGSRTDHEMRAAHDFIRRDVWAKAAQEREDTVRRVQEADADREIRIRGFDGDDDIEAAIRSYSQRHNGKAAA